MLSVDGVDGDRDNERHCVMLVMVLILTGNMNQVIVGQAASSVFPTFLLIGPSRPHHVVSNIIIISISR